MQMKFTPEFTFNHLTFVPVSRYLFFEEKKSYSPWMNYRMFDEENTMDTNIIESQLERDKKNAEYWDSKWFSCVSVFFFLENGRTHQMCLFRANRWLWLNECSHKTGCLHIFAIYVVISMDANELYPQVLLCRKDAVNIIANLKYY